jgi:hypothetical protein
MGVSSYIRSTRVAAREKIRSRDPLVRGARGRAILYRARVAVPFYSRKGVCKLRHLAVAAAPAGRVRFSLSGQPGSQPRGPREVNPNGGSPRAAR